MEKVREIFGLKICCRFWTETKREIEKIKEDVDPKIRRWFLAMMVILGIWLSLDSWTTIRSLSQYEGIELNSLAKTLFGIFGLIPGMVLFRLISVLLLAFVICFIYFTSRNIRKMSRKIALVIVNSGLTFINIVGVFVLLNNFRIFVWAHYVFYVGR